MATKTVKAPAYSEEMVTAMKAAYTANATAETVAALAEQYGKTVAQVRAKLVSLGIYKAKEYVTKAGVKPEKKDTTAEAIGKVLRLSDGEVDSLTKANKTALQKIWKALAESKPIEGGENAE